MYIDTSRVSMVSSRRYSNVVLAKREEMVMSSSEAALFTLSDKGKSAVDQLSGYKKVLEDKEARQEKDNMQETFSKMFTNRPGEIQGVTMSLTSAQELKMQLVQKLLTSFSRKRANRYTTLEQELFGSNKSYMSYGLGESSASGVGSALEAALMADVDSVSAWKKVTAVSAFQEEKEQTAYQASGMVTTKDGRQISFGVTVEMSRSFCEKYDSLTMEDYIFTDPLVINLDSNVARVSDQKFLFDLDADGKKEEMSFTAEGSGFLALDRNKDGIINDGSELFGTKSGDGFKDLAAFDVDGNGWIDEADAIFNDLRVWTKDEDGKDYLMSLKEADVGAIYLGKASTQFSLNNADDNSTNAMIRNTGVFLRESNGAVGTIQHVDFAV